MLKIKRKTVAPVPPPVMKTPKPILVDVFFVCSTPTLKHRYFGKLKTANIEQDILDFISKMKTKSEQWNNKQAIRKEELQKQKPDDINLFSYPVSYKIIDEQTFTIVQFIKIYNQIYNKLADIQNIIDNKEDNLPSDINNFRNSIKENMNYIQSRISNAENMNNSLF